MRKDTDWYKRMEKKYGSEEKIREIMSEHGKRGPAARTKPTGFSIMSEEKLHETSKKGAEKRWSKDRSRS